MAADVPGEEGMESSGGGRRFSEVVFSLVRPIAQSGTPAGVVFRFCFPAFPAAGV